MKFTGRHIIIAFICAALALLCGAVVIERSAYFDPLKKALRTDTIPPAMINYGVFGEIVTRLCLFRPVQNDATRYAPTGSFQVLDDTLIFQKKRVVDDWLFTSRERGATGLPSSRAVSGLPIIRTAPVMSINVKEEDLTGPDGIFLHYESRGRQFERLASVSYFEDGNMRFETYAGIRLHGGKSRKMKNSFRLYFRKEYGKKRIEPGLLFEDSPYAVKRLVARWDTPATEPFTSCLAFDISRKLGCAVPGNKPVFLYLNGEYKGFYFLSEHLGRKQWEEHTGHRQFDFCRFKSISDPDSEANYAAFVKVFSEKQDAFTAEFVSRYCDTDNLAAYMMAISFCGTTDGMQGVVFRDRKAEAPRWSWINWDMDHSFTDQYKKEDDDRQPWEQQGMELAFPDKRYHSVRLSLFYKLITEDPRYRKIFLEKYIFALNHLITAAYFRERLIHYQDIADRAGEDGHALLTPKREFLAHRPAFIRSQLQQIFKLAPFRCYTVKGPDDVWYIIDGNRENNGYAGYYTDKVPMRIRVAPETSRTFSHWLVNGVRHAGAGAEKGGEAEIYIFNRDAVISPVFLN